MSKYKTETYQCQNLGIDCVNIKYGPGYDSCNLQCVSNEINSRTCYGVTFWNFNEGNNNVTINCVSTIDGYTDPYVCYGMRVIAYSANQMNVFINAYYGMSSSKFYAFSTKKLIITVDGTYAD